jgi:S1-C subfamily serine protease
MRTLKSEVRIIILFLLISMKLKMNKFFILFLAFLLLGGIIAQGTNPPSEGQTINSGERIDISSYFGSEKGNVFVEGMSEGQKVKVDIVDGKASVSSFGDFKVEFINEQRTYEGFQEKEVGENKLVFKDRELTDGTSFKSDGGKDGEGQGREIDVKGYKLRLKEGDEVNIQNGITEVLTDKGISRPEKIREVEETPEFKFKSDKEVPIEGEDVNFEGSLRSRGEDFYHKKGESLSYDGVGFVNSERGQNEETFIGNSDKIPEGFDSYVIVDKKSKQIKAGSKNALPGPVLNFQEGNVYFTQWEKSDHFAVQAFGNSEISISNRDSEGLVPEVITKGQFAINEDDKGIFRDDSGKIYFRKSGAIIQSVGNTKDTTTVPIELIPYDSNGELVGKESYAKLMISNNNEYVSASLKSQFAQMDDYTYDGTDIKRTVSSRLSYNYLTEQDQIRLLQLPIEKREEYLKRIESGELKAENQKQWIDEEHKNLQSNEENIEKINWQIGDKGSAGSSERAEGAGNLQQSIMASSVRVHFSESDGSGTIIGERDGKAYILSVAHGFEGSGKTPVEIDIFDNSLKQNRKIPGRVLKIDWEKDLSIIEIDSPGKVSPAKIAPKGFKSRVGDSVITSGCSHGDDCSLQDSRILSLQNVNYGRQDMYLHGNIQISAPTPFGRSGGGAFSTQGFLIGVTGGGDHQYTPSGPVVGNRGIYVDTEAIHNFLDENGFSWLYNLIISLLKLNLNLVLYIKIQYIY